MKVQRCKGTRDLSPEEMVRFRLIEGVFRDSCLQWGYEEVRTPTLEYLHLFTSTGTLTPSMLGRVYSFLDWDGWSGERVVLRPDGTIPIARLHIDSIKAKRLAKLFYVANVFNFEQTGEKTREKWQCGAELIGVSSPLADVELIILALEVLGKLGLENTELRLSHAGLIRAVLQKLGLSSDEQNRIFDWILDGDEKALAKMWVRKPELERTLSPFLGLKGKSSMFQKRLSALFAQDLTGLEPHIDDFMGVVHLLKILGCDYQIDIASARGFEYYTGMTFQLFIGEEKVSGGGRYNALTPLLGGGDIPASGFALYVDRLMNLLPVSAVANLPANRILIAVEPDEAESVQHGFDMAHRLREAGYTAEIKLHEGLPADVRWLLEIKATSMVLSDRTANRRFEVQTASDVLRLLGGEGEDKTGAA